ncbi:MAG: helix-turn-helix domain-containing protein [Candidatus Gracilibacteria bacterium]|nr:helix-turn-helix domain-containing protein [Candidatus Gracilibacteria bacterium]
MYKFTRQDVADKLNISTRSVDRYIKSGKLRAKKDGKVVYVNTDDIENLMGNGETKQEVIVEKKVNINNNNNNMNNNEEAKTITRSDENVAGTLGAIYKDLKEEISKKDQLIQTLAMRVGKAEEVAKNSVSLIDFKKSQYLLEESKTHLDKELTNLEKEKEKLSKELKYEKNSNIILIVFVLILLAIAGTIWFMKI